MGRVVQTLVGLLALSPAAHAQVLPELVSLLPTGAVSFSGSQPIPSDDGRFVLFLGTDSFPGVQCRQWYLRDLQTGTTELVSRSYRGGPASCVADQSFPHTNSADVNADGSVVVFDFRAVDIHPSDPSGRLRTYRLNRQTGMIDLVIPDRPGWLGDGGPRIDASGTRILLQLGYASNDVRTGVVDERGTPLMMFAPGRVNNVWWELSADSRFFVANVSVPELPPGQRAQLVRKSVETGEEVIVSTNAGRFADQTVTQPTISRDRSLIAFTSFALDLTPGVEGSQILLWREGSSQPEIVSRNDLGQPSITARWQDSPSLSADGRYVAFRSRTSNFPGGQDAIPSFPQVYVRDRLEGRLTLISRSAAGAGALFGSSESECERLGAIADCGLRITPRMSADGRYVYFHSMSPDLHPADPSWPFGFLYPRSFRFDYAQHIAIKFAQPVPVHPAAVAFAALVVLLAGLMWQRRSASASWGTKA